MEISTILHNTDEIENICKKYGIISFNIFGSYARGDFREDSDIDVLVKFNEVKSLLEIVRIENVLSDTLKKKVDLVTVGSVPEKLRKSIMDNIIKVYEE